MFVVKAEADIFQLGDDFAGAFGALEINAGFTSTFTALATLITHSFEGAHTAFVTGAASFDALTNPDFFFGEFFVEQFVGALFSGQLLLAHGEEVLIAAFELTEMATI